MKRPRGSPPLQLTPRSPFISFSPRPGLRQALGEIELRGSPTEQSLRGLGQESLARAIHELQLFDFIEREDRDLDLRHNRAQKVRRLERTEPLLVQPLAERGGRD